MALSSQFQNHISRTMQFAEQVIALRNELALHRAEWDQNDMFNQLTDEDIAAIPTFAHLTKSEVSNAIGALDGIVSELGDFSTGQIVNLVKVRG